MQAAIYYKRSREQNYMMRSEKRPGYPHTPPKKPKKSIWYQLLTILMLILICPVGLIMLWRKRLRWPNPTKLLATLLSLIMLFLELGAALWYPFEDERIRHMQHTASTAIEQTVDAAGKFFSNMGANWDLVLENGQEIGAAAGNHMLGLLLDAIATPTPVPTQVPPLTLKQGAGSGNDIAALMSRPTQTPTPSPSPTPTPSPTPSPTPTATLIPTQSADASANILDRPTPSSEVPSFSLAPGVSDTPVPPVTPSPSPTATPLVTPSPTPTIVPTINPANIPRLEVPGDVLVWHTSDGTYYHRASQCGTMSNASQHTLASAVAKNKKPCPWCDPAPVEAKWAKESQPTVYVSTDHYWHTRTGCESNTDVWSPMLLDEARVDSSLRPCDACGARYYVNGMPDFTVSTDAAATSTPAPTESASLPALIAARDVTVWHTSNGSYYHKASKCGSMSNASEYTLSEAIANKKKACPYCHPVSEELAAANDYAVFAGTDSYWHTTSSCSENTADWTVLLLTEAREDSSLTPCPRCKATHYANGALPGPNGSNASIPSPEATAVADGLELSKVTNGDILVYYSGNTSHYHRRNRCASSTTTTFMPHTLMEALLENKIACPVCSPEQPITK